jgi:hypothetical protein
VSKFIGLGCDRFHPYDGGGFLADEISISVDAPTLFTGEDIMVFAYNMLLCELT